MNTGYLTSKSNKASDEVYTPYYAVEPILEFLKPNSTVWCPFDKEWSAFVNVLTNAGHKVIYTHIDNNNGNFFNLNIECDYIISNPPFSLKDKILAKLYEIGKPFMILLPLQSLQSLDRFDLFSMYGLELLLFNRRVGYHTTNNMLEAQKGNHFASVYFCNNVLPKSLIFKKLIYESRSLQEKKELNLIRDEQTSIFDILEEV